jgi:zinc/manganese transport system permease protein
MTLAGVDPVILGPAFIAGLLVVATHVPLGQQVLRRGIIFIDLAIAQIAGLGVLWAHAMEWRENLLTVQLTAFSAALMGALLLYWCERRWPEILEALIGTSFILAATAAILILANNPHAGEHLKDLLVGQILWIDADQLGPVALLYALILITWFGLKAAHQPLLFYVLFALAITASVQLVGVYLVFASLIVPAIAVRRSRRFGLLIGYGLGAVAYGGGLLLSALLDLPAGAVIVWVLAVFAIVVSMLIARYHAPLPADQRSVR